MLWGGAALAHLRVKMAGVWLAGKGHRDPRVRFGTSEPK